MSSRRQEREPIRTRIRRGMLRGRVSVGTSTVPAVLVATACAAATTAVVVVGDAAAVVVAAAA